MLVADDRDFSERSNRYIRVVGKLNYLVALDPTLPLQSAVIHSKSSP